LKSFLRYNGWNEGMQPYPGRTSGYRDDTSGMIVLNEVKTKLRKFLLIILAILIFSTVILVALTYPEDHDTITET
jgi:hypothetical protein